jgi:hypothetical protein
LFKNHLHTTFTKVQKYHDVVLCVHDCMIIRTDRNCHRTIRIPLESTMIDAIVNL